MRKRRTTRSICMFFMAIMLILSGSSCSTKNTVQTILVYSPDSITKNPEPTRIPEGNSNPLYNPAKESTILKTPCIIQTQYSTSDIVVADLIATASPYNADRTGVKDCAPVLQRAINDCYENGGGTVFLPAGFYRLDKPITVFPFVTLRGDYQDPDVGTGYGTVILANIASSEKDLPGLFTIGGSAGVIGLTVYYPNQDIAQVKPYPYTFYIPGNSTGNANYMLQSIINCTVINGYKGIGATIEHGVHEQLTVENFKGTFLYRGITAYNEADVGTIKNIRLSNEYWANAGSGLKKAERAKIDAFTRSNGIGMELGDLEWTQFLNLSVADYDIGMNIVKGKRIEFTGSIFNMDIQRCNVGLKVDSINERWGMVIARAKIEGSVKSIINNTKGAVKMTGVTLAGTTSGGNILKDDTSLETVSFDQAALPSRPPDYFINAVEEYQSDPTGVLDSSQKIQTALNTANSAGGGVVYLPPGKFRLEKPLKIPANVELRGTSPVACRDQEGLSKGTLLMVYTDTNNTNPDEGEASITLSGEGAGIRGLRVVYPRNSPASKTIQKYNYAIRGNAPEVYAVNIAIIAAYNGIDFRGCDRHFIKKVTACCYNNAIRIGFSDGGIIEGCLQNGTVIARNGWDLSPWLDESDLFTGLFDPITRLDSTFLRMDQATNQLVTNIFAYGVKTLVENENSVNSLIINSSADNLGKETPMLRTANGTLMIINMLRYNGFSYENNGTSLEIFNRLTVDNKKEKTIIEMKDANGQQ